LLSHTIRGRAKRLLLRNGFGLEKFLTKTRFTASQRFDVLKRLPPGSPSGRRFNRRPSVRPQVLNTSSTVSSAILPTK
jgi:hypothetical protein